MPNHVEIERQGNVAVYRLARPPANAIDLEFAGELESAFTGLTSDAAPGALVITGAGPCFCAGLDLKRVPHYGPEEQRAMVAVVNRMVTALYACPVPLVAAVNGHAIAGGLILVLACDYRVGTSAACQLGVTEARAGIPFPAAAMTVLKAELSPAAARVLTLRARTVDPPTALAQGILDELQPPERVLTAALAVANELAAIPSDAYARIKHRLRARPLADMRATLARGSDPMLATWLSADAASASAALLRRT